MPLKAPESRRGRRRRGPHQTCAAMISAGLFRAFFDQRRMPRYAPHADTAARHSSEGLLPFAVLAKHDANPPAVRKAFVWSAEHAMKWQNRQGTWHCVLDQPETGVDTSGSAGIAARLAAGAHLWPERRPEASRTAPLGRKADRADLRRAHEDPSAREVPSNAAWAVPAHRTLAASFLPYLY